MKWHWVVLAAACTAFALVVDAGNAGAVDGRLSAKLYPSGTRLTYQPRVSNAEMDFDWGFVSDCHQPATRVSQPHVQSLFHLRSQDQLHRTSGWSQMANSLQGDRLTQFILYSSRYAGVNNPTGIRWSQVAMRDLELAVWLHGYRRLSRRALQLPFSRTGSSLVIFRRYGTVSVLLLAHQHGNREVEGMVSSTAGPPALHRLWRALVQQVQVA